MIVPLKKNSTRSDKPVSKLPSLLITGLIFQFTGLYQSVDLLQCASHKSRSYAYHHHYDLIAMLTRPVLPHHYDLIAMPTRPFLPHLQLTKKQATASVLIYCGPPSMVLQMHQMLSKTTRDYCEQQGGFQGILKKHAYDINLSQTTLEFNQELIQMRLLGQL